MATINEQLTVMVNRVVDSVYLCVMENKLGYENFCKIVDKIENLAFNEIYKQYGTRPYRKKQFLNPVLSEVNPEADLKAQIASLSLSIRDALIMIEGKRENVNRIKNYDILKTSFLENYKTSLNKISSFLLVYNDMFLELQQCNDEFEMEKVLQEFLGSEG